MKLNMYFDYVCPFCYISYLNLKTLLPLFPGIEIVWRCCEFNPRPEPRLVLERQKPLSEPLQFRAREAGASIADMRSPVPYSDIAFQGMYYILSFGTDVGRYHDRIFEALYQKHLDIEDIEVLTRCAEGLVGDLSDFKKALHNGDAQNIQRDATLIAYKRMGIQALPTYVAEDGERLDAVLGVGVSKDDLHAFLSRYA